MRHLFFRPTMISLAIVCLLIGNTNAADSVCGYKPEKNHQTTEVTKKKQANTKIAVHYYRVARHFHLHKHYEKAIKAYENSLGYNPDHSRANNGLAWLYLTSENLEYRNLNLAVQYSEKAVSGNGSDCGTCWDTYALAKQRSFEINSAHVGFLKSMSFSGKCDTTARNNYKIFLDYYYQDRDEVRNNLLQALKSKTNYAQLYKKGKEVLQNPDETLLAMDYLTVALLAAPDNYSTRPDAHMARALGWHKMQEKQMAIFDVNRAIHSSN